MAQIGKNIGRILKNNAYPGRGIVVGKSRDGKKAMFAYFIMGRSENSRNRIFTACGDEVKTEPFDPAKVRDPSLILYSPVKVVKHSVIVTNGDQTDTIERSLKAGHCFRHALMGRTFEPDAPNYTPRISALLHLPESAEDFSYEMSVLKCADAKGQRCNRFFFCYEGVCGIGHFLHTYAKNGDPLPSFSGEPEPVKIGNDLLGFAEEIWGSLNEENKISLVCRAYDLRSGGYEQTIYNKYTR